MRVPKWLKRTWPSRLRKPLTGPFGNRSGDEQGLLGAAETSRSLGRRLPATAEKTGKTGLDGPLPHSLRRGLPLFCNRWRASG
jgi:hypothetical protein